MNEIKYIEINDQGFVLEDGSFFSERRAHNNIISDEESFRKNLSESLYRDVVGPPQENFSEVEYLKSQPSQIYTSGILFPQGVDTDDLDENLVQEESNDVIVGNSVNFSTEVYIDSEDVVEDEELNLSNSYRQSAIGLSCIVPSTLHALKVKVYVATYRHVNVGKVNGKTVENEYSRSRYERCPIEVPIQNISCCTNQSIKLREGLSLKVRVRKSSQNYRLLTVSLINEFTISKGPDGFAKYEYDQCFYQCSFQLIADDQYFLPFSVFNRQDIEDEEEQQLRLLYRNRKSFALGHGCAVDWENNESNPKILSSNSLPIRVVPPVVPRDAKGNDIYAMKTYAQESNFSDQHCLDSLRQVTSAYEEWVNDCRANLDTDIPNDLREAAILNIDKCQYQLDRMNTGIALLAKDSIALSAFRMANSAMLMQQAHFSKPLRNCDSEWVEDDFYQPWQGYWRVFQLAFILCNLYGAHRSHGKEPREEVDLIWFPTGGGKTEAYLGLSAFTIFYRRLINPLDSGCTVLMRYTLRLLTVQQFQRAASLICACEVIRSNDPQKLGEDRISLGLWVGSSLTPNKRSEARSIQSKLHLRKSTQNKFQLFKCPWCGTSLKGEKHGSTQKNLGYKAGRNNSIAFICPELRCNFSKRNNPLPISVIDEDIYSEPPSLIIGTVDKFAILAWREDAGVIFGRGDVNCSPPDLIIQDELHLISGPVGTMVGLYESAIDQLCTDENGIGPKIIGSTATIRSAAKQIKSLYNRNLLQFPSPGLDASDNYFSYEDKENSGRMYVGYCPTSASSFVTGIVRAFSSLFSNGKSIETEEEKTRDGYWTLVQYYNSLRELGRGVTLLQQDIPEFMKNRNQRLRIGKDKYRYLNNIEELNARRTAEQIPEILDQLNVQYRDEYGKGEMRALDSVLATNMISVGVDIDRLGLMAILGQPKTTSEYIQASSRVGRKESPGLVITCYNPAKPRDRSHYETFTQYHDALYRWVEPTSVTPFSVPAMDKALPAILIILSRHILGFKHPTEINNNRLELQKLCDEVISRCAGVDSEKEEELNQRITDFLDSWTLQNFDSWGGMGAPKEEESPMMATINYKSFSEGSFAIPSSLRGVDAECEVEISRGIEPQVANS